MGNSEFGTQNVELSKIVGLPQNGEHTQNLDSLRFGNSNQATQNWELKIGNSKLDNQNKELNIGKLTQGTQNREHTGNVELTQNMDLTQKQ